MEIYYAIDSNGYLISKLYIKESEANSRSDVVGIEPPNESKEYKARFLDGSWTLEPRESNS